MIKRPPRATAISLNLAPMVDVIMCLLVFFMLATRMVQRENSQIDLPEATAAKEVEKRALGNRVVVNIRSSESEEFGEAIYELDGEATPVAELYARLEREGRQDPGVNCVIRAARSVPFRFVEAVLVGCAAGKIENITFSAFRVEGGPN